MSIKRIAMPAMIAALLALGTSLPGVVSARDYHGRGVPQVSAHGRYHHGDHRSHRPAWGHRPHYRHWDHRRDYRWHRRDFDRRYSRHYRAPYYRPYYDAYGPSRSHVIIRYQFGLD